MKKQILLITAILLCGCSNTDRSINLSFEASNSSFSSSSSFSNSSSTSDNDDSFNPGNYVYDSFNTFDELPITEIQAQHSKVNKCENILGYNAKFNSELGTVELADEENFIYDVEGIYDFLQKSNKAESSSSNVQYIKGDTLSEIVYTYLEKFHANNGVNEFGNPGADLQCFTRLKALTLQKHIYTAFPHTISKLTENDKTTFFIAVENLGCSTLYIREIPGWYREDNYFSNQYLNDFANIITKNEYETYCAFFEKYGIGLINSYTFFHSPNSIYMAFHSSKGEEAEALFNHFYMPTEESLKDALNNNHSITLTDYWVNGSDDIEERFADYSLYPISFMVPASYNFDNSMNKIHPALVRYINEKCDELETEIENISQTPEYINDSFELMKKDDETQDKKVWRCNLNILESETNYSPKVLQEKGFTKVLVRPNITLSSDHADLKANSNLIWDNKTALLLNEQSIKKDVLNVTGKWFEFSLEDIANANGNIEYNVWFDKSVAPEKVELQLCYIR